MEADFTSGTTHNSKPTKPYDGDAIAAFATMKGEKTAVFLSYWSNDAAFDVPRRVTVNAKGKTKATEYRIDEGHANPAKAWRAMGSPAVPTKAQIERLTAASEVTPVDLPVSSGAVSIDMANNSAVVLVFN